MSSIASIPTPSVTGVELRALPQTSAGSVEQARKVSAEFEAMFLAQLLQPIFDAMPTDGMFGGGTGERLFRSFQVNEYARAIVHAGGIGISDAVARHLMSLQEKGNG